MKALHEIAYDSIRAGAPGLSDATCMVIAASIARKAVVTPAPAALEGSSLGEGEAARQKLIDDLRHVYGQMTPSGLERMDSDGAAFIIERAIAALQPSSAADAKPVEPFAYIGWDIVCDWQRDPTEHGAMRYLWREAAHGRVPLFLNAQPQPSQQDGVEGEIMSAEDAPVWAEGIVTDGENVAIAQKAEADYGGTYWSVETGDGAIMWEPTHFIPLAALKPVSA